MCFHVTIQLSANVEVFSYLAIAALVIWSVPSTRDRVLLVDPAAAAQRRLARAVGALDWLARFRIEHGGAGLAAVRSSTVTGASSPAARPSASPCSRLPRHGVVRPAPLVAVGRRRPTRPSERPGP